MGEKTAKERARTARTARASRRAKVKKAKERQFRRRRPRALEPSLREPARRKSLRIPMTTSRRPCSWVGNAVVDSHFFVGVSFDDCQMSVHAVLDILALGSACQLFSLL